MDESQAEPSAAKLTVNNRYPDTVPPASFPRAIRSVWGPGPRRLRYFQIGKRA